MKRKFDTRYLVELALFIAIILMMKITHLTSIPVGPLNMTLTMIPIAIGAILMGPLAGGILGSEAGTPVTVELMFTGLCVLALITALLFARNSRKHPELRLDAPNK